jgi:hypothetical protein
MVLKVVRNKSSTFWLNAEIEPSHVIKEVFCTLRRL